MWGNRECEMELGDRLLNWGNLQGNGEMEKWYNGIETEWEEFGMLFKIGKDLTEKTHPTKKKKTTTRRNRSRQAGQMISLPPSTSKNPKLLTIFGCCLTLILKFKF